MSIAESNDSSKIFAEQRLFNEGLQIAMKGAELEKKETNAADYLSEYKKSLLFLMPIAYRTASDDFTMLVRDIYLKLSIRCESIEKKENEST